VTSTSDLATASEIDRLRQALARAERSAEATNHRFLNVIERNADAILVVDAGGYVRFANTAARRLFERAGDVLEGSLFGFPIVGGETSEIDVVIGGASGGAGGRALAQHKYFENAA
jgi:PAS domain-containing protein